MEDKRETGKEIVMGDIITLDMNAANPPRTGEIKRSDMKQKKRLSRTIFEYGMESLGGRLILEFDLANSYCWAEDPEKVRKLAQQGKYKEADELLTAWSCTYEFQYEERLTVDDPWDAVNTFGIDREFMSSITSVPEYLEELIGSTEMTYSTIPPMMSDNIWTFQCVPDRPEYTRVMEPGIYVTFVSACYLFNEGRGFKLTDQEAKVLCSHIRKFTNRLLLSCRKYSDSDVERLSNIDLNNYR